MNEPQRQFAEKELREWSDLISKSIEGSLDGVIRKFKIEGEFDAWVEGDHALVSNLVVGINEHEKTE